MAADVETAPLHREGGAGEGRIVHARRPRPALDHVLQAGYRALDSGDSAAHVEQQCVLAGAERHVAADVAGRLQGVGAGAEGDVAFEEGAVREREPRRTALEPRRQRRADPPAADGHAGRAGWPVPAQMPMPFSSVSAVAGSSAAEAVTVPPVISTVAVPAP